MKKKKKPSMILSSAGNGAWSLHPSLSFFYKYLTVSNSSNGTHHLSPSPTTPQTIYTNPQDNEWRRDEERCIVSMNFTHISHFFTSIDHLYFTDNLCALLFGNTFFFCLVMMGISLVVVASIILLLSFGCYTILSPTPLPPPHFR